MINLELFRPLFLRSLRLPVAVLVAAPAGWAGCFRVREMPVRPVNGKLAAILFQVLHQLPRTVTRCAVAHYSP